MTGRPGPEPYAVNESGTCTWEVPGQDGRHLAWHPGEPVWLCAGPARLAEGRLVIGPAMARVTAPCATLPDARAAIGTWLARAAPAGHAHTRIAWLGVSVMGVSAWAVLPGRTPGQRDGLRHLTWGGPGDVVHLRAGGSIPGAGITMENYGADAGAVSGPCATRAEAADAAQAWAAAQPEPVHPRLAAAALARNTRR